MTNKEAFKEFARGVVTTIGVLGVFTFIIAILSPSEVPSTKKFEVVDRYRNCDVVRYTDETTRWHYFLDCQSGR